MPRVEQQGLRRIVRTMEARATGHFHEVLVMKASCLCGGVRFEIDGEFQYAGYCHCSECQKFSGSANSAFGGLRKEQLSVVQGQALMRYYVKYPGSHVAFCGRCGSCLLNEKIAWETTNIRLGLLDDPTAVAPSFHVYVGSKAPWHHWQDDLPKFDELPDQPLT